MSKDLFSICLNCKKCEGFIFNLDKFSFKKSENYELFKIEVNGYNFFIPYFNNFTPICSYSSLNGFEDCYYEYEIEALGIRYQNRIGSFESKLLSIVNKYGECKIQNKNLGKIVIIYKN